MPQSAALEAATDAAECRRVPPRDNNPGVVLGSDGFWHRAGNGERVQADYAQHILKIRHGIELDGSQFRKTDSHDVLPWEQAIEVMAGRPWQIGDAPCPQQI
jgi:hypothetical protein